MVVLPLPELEGLSDSLAETVRRDVVGVRAAFRVQSPGSAAATWVLATPARIFRVEDAFVFAITAADRSQTGWPTLPGLSRTPPRRAVRCATDPR